MADISTVILAAGSCSKLTSEKTKVVHKICGKAIVSWVYHQAEKINSDNIITVIGKDREVVKEALGEDKAYVIQERQLGTGHAVQVALSHIPESGVVVVLCGDVPLITAETLSYAIQYHVNSRNAATVITACVSDPRGYGRIVRGENGEVLGIVEEKDANEHQKNIKEINSGLYCFDGALLREVIESLHNDNDAGEYYLTETLSILLENGYSVGTYRTEDETEITNVSNMVELAQAEKLMRLRINTKHMMAGVCITDPEHTYIGGGCTIGKDTMVLPGTIIGPGCKIGKSCVIGPNANIKDAVIGDGCEINASTVTESTVGNNVNMGPYAYVRPGSTIADNVKVGDFVEVKNSTIGEGTKIAHLTYVGDSDVGKNVNFGCGTVTVNYDSKKKHRTTIGDNAFIGCNTNLVAPVKVGDGAYTAAGSTITEDVPGDALAIARSRQCVKENWRKKKFDK